MPARRRSSCRCCSARCCWRSATSPATTSTSSTACCRSSFSFVAEQLRIGSADAILAGRGYDTAAEVGELPQDEQRVVVLSIVRREMGVMTISCFVVVLLALRAATTSGAF